ncbi:DUF4349 domain-containing protein [Paraliobacillus ryukyuensis]|uniref:DUF4349 domain-containing protein n=1 Tax=Paraliobacillus ryukyuensis TaxID=200904 RepID=UPI0009A69B27|nr:DUF4349 domain-containing protein [Paraliobacillus ryukyuensis]
MAKNSWLMVSIIVIFTLFGCSNEGKENSGEDNSGSTADTMVEQSSTSDDQVAEDQTENNSQPNEETNQEIPEDTKTERKIIYNANLELEVPDFQTAVNQLEQEINGTGGYIVTSNAYQVEEELQEGTITARIPQEKFEGFIRVIETGDMKVVQKSVSGEDVTEQYVDLEARLKSKRVVEKRLLSFMEEAQKTEDLLKISEDLATVQEEIEQITGQMNYLENKSELATVTLHIRENHVDLVQDGDLNTWDKTVEQLKKSVNFLLASGSGLIVFFVGNLPVIILLGLVGIIGYIGWRRKRIRRKNNE